MPLYARLWTDILDDPKLIRAARDGAKGLVFLPWLIAFAKRADAEGRLEIAQKSALPRDIARSIPNAKPRQIERALIELRDLGVLEVDTDGTYRFTAWDFRNAGKTSDSREAVAARVRRHRERRTKKPVTDVTPRNALQRVTDVTDVTSKRVESREEREESREHRLKAGSTEKDSTSSRVTRYTSDQPAPPFDHPDVTAFGRMFYGDSPPDRIRDVKRQLRAAMNGRGAQLRKGVLVRAGSIDRLAAKCRDVMQDPPRDHDRAIVVLLTKLADVGNAEDSPTERAQREQHAEEQRDEADVALRLAHAEAWLADNADARAAVAALVPDNLPAISQRIIRRTAVLKAWHDAGEPVAEAVEAP